MASKRTIVLGLVLVAAAAAAIVVSMDRDSSSSDVEAQSTVPARGNNTTETQRSTSVFEEIDPGNAGVDETAVLWHGRRLATDPPKNFTGALVEFTWETVPAETGLESYDVAVSDQNGVLDGERSATSPIQLQVNASEWRFNDLTVGWATYGQNEEGLTAYGPTQIQVYTTMFTQGPPNWNYSAVE
jgi:hypothetical protein